MKKMESVGNSLVVIAAIRAATRVLTDSGSGPTPAFGHLRDAEEVVVRRTLQSLKELVVELEERLETLEELMRKIK